jgi:hypothetical protein
MGMWTWKEPKGKVERREEMPPKNRERLAAAESHSSLARLLGARLSRVSVVLDEFYSFFSSVIVCGYAEMAVVVARKRIKKRLCLLSFITLIQFSGPSQQVGICMYAMDTSIPSRVKDRQRIQKAAKDIHTNKKNHQE